MGIFKSKIFHKTPEMPPNMQPVVLNPTQKFEDNNLAKMRRQLYNDAPTFILNNLLLSVQFFNNFEKDIADLRISNVSRKENRINTQLSEHQKHCLLPDTLHELIDSNVCFQPKHGRSKYYTETLHSQRILVAYDNIEVRNPSETVEYSSALDGPIYKCVIEGSEFKGYVKLKLKEIERKRNMSERANSEQTTEREISSENDENDDEVFVYQDNSITETDGQNNLVRQLSLTIPKMISPAEKSQQSEYTYHKITEHFTLKPLKQPQNDATDGGRVPLGVTELPNKCVTSVLVKVYRDEIEEEEEKRKLREKYPNVHDFQQHMLARKKRELFEKITYLNSIAFCDYFGDSFPQYIGETLGFTKTSIQLAMLQNAVIYIDVMNKETKHVTNYEVIPSLTSSWTDEAYEWRLRTRSVIQDERTQTAYRWPTPGMISRVISLPNHIYPIGYHPKRGDNPNRDLQWRLQFPAAERFLESHLHHAQIRCYLITLTFFKSFIESKEIKLGLNGEHIRTHLFWECERDFVHWPENRLGEKLKVFLKNLRAHLENQELPDFFIPSRNLFENIPRKYLSIAQRKICDILENPVMYTIKALRNLKYRKKLFYPVLDYNKLYSILTSDNIIELVNPQIRFMKEQEKTETKENKDDSSDDEKLDPVQRWYKEAYRQIQEEREIEKKKKERVRRVSCDSINSEIKPVRTMEVMRQMLVLKLFISHFIEMARASNTFDNSQQGLMYLQQAKNLNILLGEMTSGQEDEIEYAAQILQVEELLKISLAKEEVLPKIPARSSRLHDVHINRNKKKEIITNNPNMATTSSNYVNVEHMFEKPNDSLKCTFENLNMQRNKTDELHEVSQNNEMQIDKGESKKHVSNADVPKNTASVESIYNEKSPPEKVAIKTDPEPLDATLEQPITVQVDVHSPPLLKTYSFKTSKCVLKENILNEMDTSVPSSFLNDSRSLGHHDQSKISKIVLQSDTDSEIITNQEKLQCPPGDQKWLNESCTDDYILAKNDFDGKIEIRSDVSQRPKISSIILSENSEEVECTEL